MVKKNTSFGIFFAAFGFIYIYLFFYTNIAPVKAKEYQQLDMPISVMPTYSRRTLRLPIIMYHYVEYVKDRGDTIRQSLNINPYLFERQLRDLKNADYETYFVRDIPGIMSSGSSPKKAVILTFDDGYEDFYENAYPLLKKYNFKASIYMIVHSIDKPGFLTHQELEEMIDSGYIEVGSHTLDHMGLAGLDEKTAREQIIESKHELEKILHIPITTFAYPSGLYDAQTIALSNEAGYTVAITTNPGLDIDSHDLFEVPRLRAGYLNNEVIQSEFAL